MKWALGLTYVMSGFPHKALQEWKDLSVEEIPHIMVSKKNAEEKLPTYEKLYQKYNDSLDLVKGNEFGEARTAFKELLSFQEEVPLPFDFYEGYLLSSALEEVEGVGEDILTFPIYIQNHPTIIEIQKKLKLQNEPVSNQNTNKKKAFKKVFYITGLAASIMIGAFVMNDINERSPSKNAAIEQPVVLDPEKIGSSQDQVANLETKITQLQSDKDKLLAELENQALKIEEQTKVQEILTTANVDYASLEAKAGLVLYQKGVSAYENKQYEEAVSFFDQSHSAIDNEYYSDDALYYFIQSKKKLEQVEGIEGLYDKFLLTNNIHFKDSPYYDDVLLEKAEWLSKVGEDNKAITLLEQIQSEYPEEWTALRSKNIMKEIMGVKDASN